MTNPLLSRSALPYNVPDWGAIKPGHIVPALKELMAAEREAWEQIATNAEPATVANTVDALEDAGLPLALALNAAYTLMSSIGGDELDAVQSEVLPLLSEHANAFRLDRRIYDRFAAIDRTGLDPETVRYITEELDSFTRSGITLDDADKARLRDLDSRLSTLEVEFSQRVIKAMDDNAAVLGPDDVAGVDDARLAAARQDDGTYRFALDNFTNQTLQVALEKPEARAAVLQASLSRGLGAHASSDTRELVLQIARLRAERAELLGYPHHAQAVADAGMAKDSQAIVDLLGSVAPKALAAVERDRVKLDELAAADRVTLTASDYSYYQEKLRGELGLDDEALKPYLELNNVVENGIFFAAGKLYGLTFKPRPDIAGWVDSCKTWEVFDESGEGIALFQADYFRRKGKSGGAWMNPAVDGSAHDGLRPVILNNCNFPEPADGEPCLLSWDNVITVFHEFGHALHGILTRTTYRSLAGTEVPRDFVELPSQLNEMWAYNPQVMTSYARHYKTGEPLPEQMARKLTEAATFGQALDTTEFLAAALLDQAWHRLRPDEVPTDVAEFEAFEEGALRQMHIFHELVPPRYRSAYFAHTFGGGYDAGYYSYMWAEVLVADLENWFRNDAAIESDGGLNRAAGRKLASELLSRGNSRDPMESFVAVRGRKPRAEALLERRGLA
ncbi:M3 family metallopeptidase [Trueperella abortisuis]|uniref:Peptidyl-dipeptidase Dcp n=1 Tax=Trueperella abortisuis TaxID=445930 RepID=A0ABT9PJT9_9ACTO|nr:M3 family metallopeptidase [Trueperella abortisuis]MDP9832726.1 peptidyl-dipeptidase Dcp [Trueperella abortisuis]